MASEADYPEEIQSPDGEDQEEGEAGDSDDDDRSEVLPEQEELPDDVDDPALNGTPEKEEAPPPARSVSDVDSSSDDIHSPSSYSASDKGDHHPPDTFANESRSSVSSVRSEEGSEDERGGMGPLSPHSELSISPPHAPPQSPNCNGGGVAVKSEPSSPARQVRQVAPLPVEKGPLEDQEGELDFEEETPEEKRDGAEPSVTVEVIPKVEPPEGKLPEGGDAPVQELNQSLEEGEEDELEEGEEGSKSTIPGDAPDPDDDGEVEDDDDLEEGEVKDGYVIRKQVNRTICRFFLRGVCTWGNDCRFIHPGINDKGNYSMFSTHKPLVPSNGPGFGWHGGSHRTPYAPRPYVDPAPPPPPPPPPVEEPVVESAWERGLRHAKEILKKSSKRKETEPDFEDKRMNLGLSVVAGDGSNEFEKENDYYGRSPYDQTAATDPYAAYSYDDLSLDPYERQAQDYWRGGNYENFEVRYTRSDFPTYREHQHQHPDRLRERGRDSRFQEPRERERGVAPFRDGVGGGGGGGGGRGRRDKFERQRSPERNWREERYVEPQLTSTRARGDEWRDPWRRSTSPKRRHLSRSYSSHSSASYSSSRSSVSRSSSYTSQSRSSSGSSASSYSSRSYSHSRSKSPVKRKGLGGAPPPPSAIGIHMQKMRQSMQHQQQQMQQPGMDRRPQHPPPTTKAHARPSLPPPGPSAMEKQRAPLLQGPMPTVVPPALVVDKKKGDRGGPPSMAPQRRRPSSSGSESASRSRNRVAKLGAWPPGTKANKSGSRSRSSRSRSTSISSLESVSSKSSISSKSSFGSGKNVGSKLPLSKKGEKRIRDRERQRGGAAVVPASGEPSWKGPQRQQNKMDGGQADLRVKSSVNAGRTSKDLLKQSGQKPQIKLTLLNKEKSSAAPPSSMFDAPELRASKQKPPPPNPISEKEAPKAGKGPIMAGKKRPLPSPVREGPDTANAGQKVTPVRSGNKTVASPSPPGSPPSGSGKKSTSSRREELLKQLKAVEDAIARKRSKLS